MNQCHWYFARWASVNCQEKSGDKSYSQASRYCKLQSYQIERANASKIPWLTW